MSAREIKIKQEERSVAKDYLKKAADNYEQMLAANQADNSNAAATLAIQCVISSADAICVFEKGILLSHMTILMFVIWLLLCHYRKLKKRVSY